MLGGLDHVVLFVRDLERATGFYRETLGLQVLVESPHFVALLAGGQMIGLHPSEADGRDVGVGPIPYFRVADVEAVIGQLHERGVHVHQQPKRMPSGQLIATIHDSEGNCLGLVQNPA